ncbi:VOC family protein [Nocardia terpenica]|uniref:Lactoylglutathione lyase n=1 Tax=Nocardia terpenica TaxID=455432 RepID=A0A291RJK2_9NOCA|nr:lactoylglutathione lyase [Nocardia terpenica]
MSEGIWTGGVNPVGLHHVAINVTDVDRALHFYVDILGLTQRTDRPDLGIEGAWLNAGNQQIHLIQSPVPPAVGQHFALLIAPNQLETTVSALRSQGLTVSDPHPIAPGHSQSFVSDPDGNVVELHQANVD